MHVESLSIENFRCFGPGPTRIDLQQSLTAFIGPNGSGKTAVLQALLRLFGTSSRERDVRFDDFHVPADEATPASMRSLRIEAILAFPELDDPARGASAAVPAFFQRMTATEDGRMRCRIVLEATWTADATVEGTVETELLVIQTLENSYEREHCVPLPASERARIQAVYVPSNRDGARQVTAFLRGRLWRAAMWSDGFQTTVASAAGDVEKGFLAEDAAREVQAAVAKRWADLHAGDVHSTPTFAPLSSDVPDLVRQATLAFEPDHARSRRSAEFLSDGQRSLLHVALTSASLDIESKIASGGLTASFTLRPSDVPILTVLALEEPENNLSPFFLSRIVTQLLEVSASGHAQSIVATHAPGALHRVEPEWIRHFRLDSCKGTAIVRPILLPDKATEAGTFVREAVRAHPELYFARFVVLGEGDTEEVVIPRIAQALGVPLDPSFVAMVPLGGRHTNHFWKLLRDLDIPHATLVDLDYGRAGGGAGRLKDAFTRLRNVGEDPFAGLEGLSSPDEVTEVLSFEQLISAMKHLQTFGVFFSAPLDLDMLMLEKYQEAYTTLESGQRGPDQADAVGAVFKSMPEHACDYWLPADTAVRSGNEELFRWYRYLFLTRSKPASHLAAIGRLADAELKDAPRVLTDLVEYVRGNVGL